MADSKEIVSWDAMDNWNFCRFCRHLNSLIEKPTCNAFPEGIPQEILSGKIIHKDPLPNQANNIVLTPW
jgi:hypothetical protein